MKINIAVIYWKKETLKDTKNDSVEGIAFSKDTSVIMTGEFVTMKEVFTDQEDVD